MQQLTKVYAAPDAGDDTGKVICLASVSRRPDKKTLMEIDNVDNKTRNF